MGQMQQMQKKKKRGAKYQGTKVTDSKVKFVSPGPLWLQCDGNFHSQQGWGEEVE